MWSQLQKYFPFFYTVSRVGHKITVICVLASLMGWHTGIGILCAAVVSAPQRVLTLCFHCLPLLLKKRKLFLLSASFLVYCFKNLF